MLDNISVLVFDLGNVIVDINIEATRLKISQLLAIDNLDDQLISRFKQLSREYEVGYIDSSIYFSEASAIFDHKINETQLREAWNLTIVGFNPQKLSLLKKLRETHTIALLSNTNPEHIDYCNLLLAKMNAGKLDDYFDHIFYSYQMGMAKPSEQIYFSAQNTLSVNPDKLLFFDDLPDNIKSARLCGWHAQLIVPSISEITHYFAPYGL